jgi:virginiamycin B lyase
MRFTTSCGLRKPFLVFVAFASLGQLCTSLIAQTVSFTEYPIPTAGSQPSRIATGSDGALWFTEFTGNKIGRSTTAGVITEFTVPTAASQPTAIAAGPDGALWFTEQAASKIGRITTAGAITEFSLPTAASGPIGITAGPDGALWFAEGASVSNKIGRITTAGIITEFPVLTAASRLIGITPGPDGALWFTEQAANQIGRITTTGAVTEFAVPTAASQLSAIVTGADGALWFIEIAGNKVGRITTAGVVTEFPVPTPASNLSAITTGPDGALWFTEVSAGNIGRITTGGTITEFPLPVGGNSPQGITTGPDGALWFTEQGTANKIGRAFVTQISAATHFVAVSPCRVADTRTASGPFGGPAIVGGTSRDFVIPNSVCGIPSNAAGYSLNVAVVPRGTLGFLTLWPSGLFQPLVATLNSIDGRTKSNAAIVPAGANGAVSVFATDTTDVILDINGYFVAGASPTALAFYPLTPCRVADTRLPTAPLQGPSLIAQGTRSFPILGSPCGLPANAQAYSLNFAAVPKGPTLGFLTAWPAGQSQPLVASLNDPTGTVLSNAVIVPAGVGGAVNVFATDNTDLVIDINGYFAAQGPGGLSLYTVTPCRVLDTRIPAGSPPFSATRDVNVTAAPCGAPVTAQAFVFNATVVPPGFLGYITMWPQGQTQPLAANLNAYDGTVTNNMAIVPTTTGSVSVFPSAPTHLVLDIFGYFAP